MYHPNLNKFQELSTKGNLIPIYKEIEISKDIETPTSVFLKMRASESQYAFLFETVEEGKWGRYSFIGTNPSKIIKAWGKRIEILEKKKVSKLTLDNPIEVLRAELATYTPVPIKGLPSFYGGLVGYFGYEAVQYFERVPQTEKPSLDLPDFIFLVIDTIVIFDRTKDTIKIVSNAYINNKQAPEEAYNKAIKEIDRVSDILQSSNINKPSFTYI